MFFIENKIVLFIEVFNVYIFLRIKANKLDWIIFVFLFFNKNNCYRIIHKEEKDECNCWNISSDEETNITVG